MEIFKLLPSTVSTIWGGRKLIEDYGIKTDLENCAEAWMLSCYPGRESKACGGDFDGLTLAEISEKCGKAMFGKRIEKFDSFPILIKFIDARDDLSVQVHPDDDYARSYNGGFGKTECWYIMDSEPGAKLIYGFKNKITTKEFADAIQNGTIEDVVNYVEVKKGDFFLIEAGTLHAIGKGILLAEIQQNSDTTFRAYDYNRFDARCNGPRPLHIKETLDVTKCEPPCPSIPTRTKTEKLPGAEVVDLVSFDLFTVKQAEVDESYVSFAGDESFVHVMVLDGAGAIECGGKTLDITKGEGIFIPAGSGEYKISGKLSIIESGI